MSHQRAMQEAFRQQIVRFVVGCPPAGHFIVADHAGLQGLAKTLADLEQARAVLRANGWGDFGTSILEVANAIPKKAKP